MSPSLASDGHPGHSNTLSASDTQRPNHSSDALPMITTSHFDSTIGASGQDVPLSSPFHGSSMCTVPQLPAHWSKLAEQVHGLAASRPDEHAAPSATGVSPFSSSLAVPLPAYTLVGSSFDLPSSLSMHGNSHNDLATLDEQPSTHAAFLFTGSRVVKVSFLADDHSVGLPGLL